MYFIIKIAGFIFEAYLKNNGLSERQLKGGSVR
jgi:hypothetical protein